MFSIKLNFVFGKQFKRYRQGNLRILAFSYTKRHFLEALFSILRKCVGFAAYLEHFKEKFLEFAEYFMIYAAYSFKTNLVIAPHAITNFIFKEQ